MRCEIIVLILVLIILDCFTSFRGQRIHVYQKGLPGFSNICGYKRCQIQTLYGRDINSISEDFIEPVQWTTKGYRRPLHWVQKVAHLEDTLSFYKENFDMKVYRHEEFSSGCEATCNGPYGGAWSKTIIGSDKCTEEDSFCFELVYNYGINRYDRGNDLRQIGIRKSSFCGDKDIIGYDDSGRQFVQTPDGHFINLIDDNMETNTEELTSLRRIDKIFDHIAIHVSNITESIAFYRDILCAKVEDIHHNIAKCYWYQNSVSIMLHQLENDESVDFGEAKGRFAIATNDGAIEEIYHHIQQQTKYPETSILHGPIKLQPHNEEVIIIADPDGHEYCFVDARGYQNCINVGKTKVCLGV